MMPWVTGVRKLTNGARGVLVGGLQSGGVGAGGPERSHADRGLVVVRDTSLMSMFFLDVVTRSINLVGSFFCPLDGHLFGFFEKKRGFCDA